MAKSVNFLRVIEHFDDGGAGDLPGRLSRVQNYSQRLAKISGKRWDNSCPGNSKDGAAYPKGLQAGAAKHGLEVFISHNKRSPTAGSQ
jgi:hypothetical protein